jgi:hypothetical protein
VLEAKKKLFSALGSKGEKLTSRRENLDLNRECKVECNHVSCDPSHIGRRTHKLGSIADMRCRPGETQSDRTEMMSGAGRSLGRKLAVPICSSVS